MKSLCLVQISNWKHHHDGWGYVLKHLQQLHNPYAIPCLDWIEGAVKWDKIPSRPWTGFAHNAINYPSQEEQEKYRAAIRPLSELVQSNCFAKCKGIFTFSKYTAGFLKSRLRLPVEALVHPMPLEVEVFDSNSLDRCRLISIGQWLRRHQTLCEIKTDLRKCILAPGILPGIETVPSATYQEYEKILHENVVFLDFYDVAACNVILECIARSTPLLVRRLPACAEYLGDRYPLFYSTPEQASKLLTKTALLEAHHYLREMDKSCFQASYFVDQICNGSIAASGAIFW